MNEKQELEKAAIQEFLPAFNSEFPQARLKIVSFGDSPDFVVRQSGSELAIEVAHSFGSQFDAQNRLGRAGDFASLRLNRELWDRHLRNATIPLATRILGSLNDVLRKKALKSYGKATWLLIRNANPLWGRTDFQENAHLFHLPNHHFHQVWLLCGQKSSDGILRLA